MLAHLYTKFSRFIIRLVDDFKIRLARLTYALDLQGPVLRFIAFRCSEFLPLRLHKEHLILAMMDCTGLCCTNRVKDVFPLSPYAPSLQVL